MLSHMILALAAICSAVAAAAATFTLVRGARWRGRLVARRGRVAAALDAVGAEAPSWAAILLALAVPLSLWMLAFERRRMLARIDAQLADALALVAGALRAGVALPQGLEMASLEMPLPIGRELARAVAQMKLGKTVEEALAAMAARLPTEDVALVVQTVEILRRTGGNLGEAFRTLAQTIEGRRRVQDRIRVLTAQGLFQGIVLLALPWVLAAALAFLSPGYLSPLFRTNLGFLFLAVGIFLEVGGALWLKRIVFIRV